MSEAPPPSLPAEVYDGDKRQAVLYSVQANHDHGHRRSPMDKRRAVKTLLEMDAAEVAADPENRPPWSDHEIARRCLVSHHTVADVRRSLTGQTPSDKRRVHTKHGTITTMNTANIGKRKPHPSVRPSEPVRMGFPPLRKASVALPHGRRQAPRSHRSEGGGQSTPRLNVACSATRRPLSHHKECERPAGFGGGGGGPARRSSTDSLPHYETRAKMAAGDWTTGDWCRRRLARIAHNLANSAGGPSPDSTDVSPHSSAEIP